MKALFERKTYKEQIVPQDEFKIEKIVELPKKQFDHFLNHLLDDYDFIKENIPLMFVDDNDVWHTILVTTKEIDYGILVESEGYNYARYAAYINKSQIGGSTK